MSHPIAWPCVASETREAGSLGLGTSLLSSWHCALALRAMIVPLRNPVPWKSVRAPLAFGQLVQGHAPTVLNGPKFKVTSTIVQYHLMPTRTINSCRCCQQQIKDLERFRGMKLMSKLSWSEIANEPVVLLLILKNGKHEQIEFILSQAKIKWLYIYIYIYIFHIYICIIFFWFRVVHYPRDAQTLGHAQDRLATKWLNEFPGRALEIIRNNRLPPGAALVSVESDVTTPCAKEFTGRGSFTIPSTRTSIGPNLVTNKDSYSCVWIWEVVASTNQGTIYICCLQCLSNPLKRSKKHKHQEIHTILPEPTLTWQEISKNFLWLRAVCEEYPYKALCVCACLQNSLGCETHTLVVLLVYKIYIYILFISIYIYMVIWWLKRLMHRYA